MTNPSEEKMAVTESLPVVDAVRRELEIDEQVLDGRPRVRAVLTLTTHLSRSPAQLWPLLTDPARLARWFGPVDGELVEGGTFRGPRGARGRIETVEAPHRLSLVWEREGAADPLLIRLDPEDDGTTALSLRHTTLLDRQDFARGGPGLAAMDWEIALLALAAETDGWRDTCQQEVPVPTADWLDGPDGAGLVRAWSVRWAAQALAAGVDEETVRRGENATVHAFEG
ncbi:SRPBCC domain-containing protein [Brachybacterium sp. J144]|uniref:SRPBCC domain-containing protein n=1 Tax=Brachybacterium sp. J144 TaxID=3116487 RepID=UPI002E790A2D|nr:SRPBCC domain-containing protein [Brachybacterium sp. J144]MEE1651728.1 SRPBCC domain-containing protein [Brachybacterium sp. J144]